MSEQPQDADTKRKTTPKSRPLTTLNIPPDLHDLLQKRWHQYCVENDVRIPFGDWHNSLFKLQIVDCSSLPIVECKTTIT